MVILGSFCTGYGGLDVAVGQVYDVRHAWHAELAAGRPAPDPTEPGSKGQPRLAPAFVEWLMGLPAGWVTNHLPRPAALRVLGNGVVPAQAAHAIRLLEVSRAA